MTDKLKELALAAKPEGPWFVCRTPNNDGTVNIETGRASDWTVAQNCEYGNAAYIAAASPDVVLALIAEVERLKARNADLEAKVEQQRFILASGAAIKTRPTTREEKIANPGVYVTQAAPTETSVNCADNPDCDGNCCEKLQKAAPKKPAECANGCPDMQVCDYCQGTGGDDAQAAPKGEQA